MKGDFTRNTFDPDKNFTRVLMQQGRVLLDSDWNEQAEIQQHYLRKLAMDLIGPHAGPASDYGFAIETLTNGSAITNDLKIGFGSYYVDGIRCENKKPEDGKETTYYGLNKLKKSEYDLPKSSYLVYLDVWEHHITSLEDDNLREVALGGSDTTTRSKVVWQVKVWPLKEGERSLKPMGLELEVDNFKSNWDEWKKFLNRDPNGLLKAQAKVDTSPRKIEPCAISPEARYSGPENRLYRVEIHKGGDASDATFKWSRENGSVVFPIRDIGQGRDNLIRATLEHLGRGDDRKGLNVGDWVEVESDEIHLRNEALQINANPLLKVKEISKNDKVVYLDGNIPTEADSNRILRRWDQRAADPKKGGLELDGGASKIEEGKWLNLEDGIKIWFDKAGDTKKNFYRTGDYWLIPARMATGNVQWPQSAGGPLAIPPHGVEHHYAPLKIIGHASGNIDCRRKITTLWE